MVSKPPPLMNDGHWAMGNVQQASLFVRIADIDINGALCTIVAMLSTTITIQQQQVEALGRSCGKLSEQVEVTIMGNCGDGPLGNASFLSC